MSSSTQHSTDLDRELEQMAQAELARERTEGSRAAEPTSLPREPVSVGLVQRPGADFPLHERNVAVGVHLGTLAATVATGGLFLPVLVPLVMQTLSAHKSKPLQHHVREQLNFQLTLATVALGGLVGTFLTLGVGLLVFLPVILFFLGVETVASIKGALAASRGEEYEFPFTYDFLK